MNYITDEPDFGVDGTIKVDIKKPIRGKDPKYDAWSIDAEAWIERDGEEHHRTTISINVLKDDGNFDDDGGRPHIINRIKAEYKKILKEKNDYNTFSVQSLESEKDKVEALEGKTFEIDE